RLEGITYEAQKIIPIDYKGYTVAQSALDLVVWTDEKPSTGIVVDLKTESCVKEEFDLQVKRYIKKLRELEDERSEQNRRNIYNKGMVIAFSKASTKQIVCDEEEGVYFAFVDEHESPEFKVKKKKEE
ncbi:hypothetical protein GF338_05920, partial [candidate division WOR-3 bacterium]|nr:hypothetical protein [candidate division WOR-3 bacterium]